jgi:hypothetical protein
VVLTAPDGDIMVAGRVRVVPHGNPAGAIVVDNHDITNAANASPVANSPIVITTAQKNTLHTGDQVIIKGVKGNSAANGTFTITVLNDTSFSLNGTTSNGSYLGGGTWSLVGSGISYTEASAPLALSPAFQPTAADVASLNAGVPPTALIEALDAQLPQPITNTTKGYLVKVLARGLRWQVVRVEQYNDEGGTPRDRFRYGETYTVTLTGPGTASVTRDWLGVQYPTGYGNFPLWESSLLRDKVFRKLFVDWQDGSQQFPDLGDTPTLDPQTGRTAPVVFGQYPAYQPPTP